MKACCLLLLSFVVAGPASAQAPLSFAEAAEGAVPAAEPKIDRAREVVFRSRVDLVALSVTVTGPQQRFVTDLTAENFTVFEDGVPQDVSFFASSELPLDLALLLDTSASMIQRMGAVRDAAAGFVSTIREGDRVTIVDIKDGVKTLHPLGGDVAGARAAIARTSARGGTALYNGLYMTLREIAMQRRDSGEMRREAIVVLSDGGDTASLIAFEDVMRAARESGIPIYTITLKSQYSVAHSLVSDPQRSAEADFAMRQLAEETGGRAFAPKAIEELAGVYDLIAEELASQYALGYTPANADRDGSFRRVTVRVDQPGARIRTRSGYFSSGVR